MFCKRRSSEGSERITPQKSQNIDMHRLNIKTCRDGWTLPSFEGSVGTVQQLFWVAGWPGTPKRNLDTFARLGWQKETLSSRQELKGISGSASWLNWYRSCCRLDTEVQQHDKCIWAMQSLGRSCECIVHAPGLKIYGPVWHGRYFSCIQTKPIASRFFFLPWSQVSK